MLGEWTYLLYLDEKESQYENNFTNKVSVGKDTHSTMFKLR